jgi:hypothetical protein
MRNRDSGQTATQVRATDRAVDVKKVRVETRHTELENLRRAARLQKQQLGGPDIEKVVLVADGKGATVEA